MSELASQPVVFYAAVFFLVNVTFIALIWELIERTPVKEVSPKERRIMRFPVDYDLTDHRVPMNEQM